MAERPERCPSNCSQGRAIDPWHVTRSREPDVARASRQRIVRARRGSQSLPPFTCPTCGRTMPGLTLSGTPRRACSDPRCYGRAWNLAWVRATERQRATLLEAKAPERTRLLSPDEVRAVRAFEGGIRATAAAMGLSRSRVERIRRGLAYAWVPDEPITTETDHDDQ